jgi:hypothetical protein
LLSEEKQDYLGGIAMTDQTRNSLHALLGALLSLLCVGPALAQSSTTAIITPPPPQRTQDVTTTQRTQVPPQKVPDNPRQPTSGQTIGVVIVDTFPPLFSSDPLGNYPVQPNPPDPRKILDKKGPQLPDRYSTSFVSIQGYTRANWPVVIEYQVLQPSLLYLTVSVDGFEPYFFRLDGRNVGRYQQRLQLPARFPAEPRPARYFIRALSDNIGQLQPRPFYIYGIAAGERAVGSLGIDQLHFGPSTISAGRRASYSFNAHFDFDKVQPSFFHLGRQADGQFVKELVCQQNEYKVAKGPSQPQSWDCKPKNGAAKGSYTVMVRAWRDQKNGGDWVTTWSDQYVVVQ